MPRSLPTALALLGLASAAAAQGRDEKHAQLGLSLTRPSDYERLPVRPRERFGVLSYVERMSEVELAAGERPATLDVYLVPRADGAGESVVDATSFLLGVLAPRSHRSLRAGRQRFGHEPLRWEVELVDDEAVLAGWVHAWQGPARTYVVVGRCAPAELASERSRWQRCAEAMRLFDPIGGDAQRQRWERYYAGRRGLVGIEHRIQARLALVDGWKVRDSEHYIVLSHDVDEGFVIELARAVETLRDRFAQLCPPEGVLDRVSTMRVCRDQAEYLAYGGWRGSVGYWSPGEEELVVFDARERTEPQMDGEHYTRAVLFHEAFHQYVHYAAEGIAPHSWFDEGMAEYFGGALVEGRRCAGIEPNRYRLENAQALLQQGTSYPWQAVTALDQQEFYADPARLYAQAWSMVHFLAASPEAQRDRRWREILPTYFRTLRGAWAGERRRLSGGGSLQEATRRARERARAAAFADVDWDELEAAWSRHLASLRMPGAR